MQIFTRILFVALALGSMTLSAAVAQSLNNEPAQTLEEVANTELDVVLALPDADLSGYTKLILPPLEVEYQRGNSRMYRLSKSDLRKLDDLGRETFRKHLTGEGGYEIVSAPGPGTLVLRTRLTNVWLAFSNNSVRSARSYTLGDYVLKMTLEAVLLDAETNEVLAIVSDRQGRRVNSTLRRVTSVEAWREARRAFDFWATRIRQGIDERAAPSAP